MFILDEIACALESVEMFVEEKVDRMLDPTSPLFRHSSSSDTLEPTDETEDDYEETKSMNEYKSPEDFDEYLREGAMGALFPCGVPESIKRGREK
ncbi:hypothetical protein C818_00219 [Lachnospiraceae bacterium MD308]|nr:hypothetical protein C818_00219 [Lachnospiraceae bacterium MD308]